MSELHSPSEIYHLKIRDDLPQTGLARCNRVNSQHWTKYKTETFQRGTKFNIIAGEFENIPGKACKRCLNLISGR